MATLLSRAFSWLILLFMMAATAPLFCEVWIEQGWCAAFSRIFKQMITGAPLHFIFQAKIIGVYTTNEIRYGGATYLATGRGLPTERRPFFKKEGGLYLDWAEYAFYDGFRLLVAFGIVILLGGLDVESKLRWSLIWWCISLVITAISWLYAPFMFNPYQFAYRYFRADMEDWKEFFLDGGGQHWRAWHEKTVVKPENGLRATLSDIVGWMLFIACWYTVLNSKFFTLTSAAGVDIYATQVWALLPPVNFSFLFVCIVPPIVRCAAGNNEDLHLAIVALVVSGLDVLEAVLSLRQLLVLSWWKSFGAGLIMNYAMLSCVLFIVECSFRFKEVDTTTVFWIAVKRPIKIWLYSHRMAFDLLVSSILFLTLSPMVLFDRVRSMCCYGCSLHAIFLFRDPGHLSRVEARAGTNQQRAQSFNTDASADLGRNGSFFRQPAAAPQISMTPPTRSAMLPATGSGGAVRPPAPPAADQLPDGWESIWSEEHSRTYYCKRSTGESSWTRPQ